MDFLEKSFASASEASKLLITLSTGVIAFTVAVVNVKAGDSTLFTPVTTPDKIALSACWLLLVCAVGMGVWTQLAITHVLSEGTNEEPADPWSKKIRFPFILQIALFVLGILLLVLYSVSQMF